MSNTATALIAFAAWYALLTLAMAIYRSSLMLSGKKAANSFATDGSDLDPLGRRITRARDNCYETLPLFAAIALGASIAGRLDVTDGLAMWVFYLRVGQSITHVASGSVPAVMLRANFFFAQVLIYVWWAAHLLA